MLNSHWDRATTGKKNLASMHAGSLQSFPTLCYLADCGLPGFSVKGVLQARTLECIGQYWLPYLWEHYTSYYPSHQPPWVPGAARNPATQAAAPHPHLGLTGADPSPPGQPQEQTPVDDPHAEVEIKPQLNPRAVWVRKKTQNLPTSCTSCRLHPRDQVGRLCVYGIYKWSPRAPTKENAAVLMAVDIGGNNTQK